MSSEMVKRRGRSKKAITELMAVEMSEVTKQTTRAKSTKAAPKTVKPKASSAVKKPILEAVPSQPAAKSAQKPVPPAVKAPAAAKNAPAQSSLSTMASPILAEVEKLKKEQTMAAEATSEFTQASSKISLNKSSSPIPDSTPSTNLRKSVQPTAPSNHPPSPPPSNPTPPKPRLLIAALNSAIVSNLSTRAGARPNATGSKQLPQNYKSVSRKVTMTIVAMPVMIVTSYVLYQRLVLGEERKHLVNADPPSAEPAAGLESA